MFDPSSCATLDLRAVQATCVEPTCDYQGVGVILDSGADRSCLPMSFAQVGTRGSPARAQFRDAQGKVIDAQETRVATMEIGGISFKEHWLVAPVTAPLLSLGKLLRTGWSVSPAANQDSSLVKDDVCIPVFLKHNSLCVTADVRMLAVNDDCSNLRSCEIRALNVTGTWNHLPDYFTEVADGVFAIKCYTMLHLDINLHLPREGVEFRTTLLRRGNEWEVEELNVSVSTLDVMEGKLPEDRRLEVIVIASREPRSLSLGLASAPSESSGVQRHVNVPSTVSPSPEELGMQIEVPETGEVQQDSKVMVPAEAQAELDARVRDEEKDSKAGPVVFGGVTLNLECTLSTLRAAATSLGLGKSGGKATVLKRISDHLKKQQLIQQHQARADLDKPVTPREQAVVNAPSLEEQRKHALTHLPYASWCPHCVSFRAKADRHLKSQKIIVLFPRWRTTFAILAERVIQSRSLLA